MSVVAGLSKIKRSMMADESVASRKQGSVTHATAVRRAIESDIFSGKLLPGAEVDEDAIARAFSISRTPVREAILALTHSGLIEKLPRRGVIVARLDVSRLVQLFETTSELEALCARFAASRISLEERTLLGEIHDQAAAALANNDETLYARLGGRFHAMIMLASHNNVLIETTDRLALHTLPYRRFQLRLGGRSDVNQADHTRILEAIQAKDAAAAYDTMRRHVMVQGDVLAEYISVIGPDSRV